MNVSVDTSQMNLPNELTIFLKKVKYIQTELNEINGKNEVLEKKYEECLKIFTQKNNQIQFQQYCQDISKIIKETTASILIREQEINEMKTKLQREKNPFLFRIKQNHIGVLSKSLLNTIKHTRSLQETIKSTIKLKYEKEISSLKIKSIPNEYQTIKPKKERSFIQELQFKRELSKESLKKVNFKVLSYVKQKHDQIINIVNSIDEVAQMILDIKLLVDEQSLLINNIVDNCEQAQEYIQQSIETIQSSKQLQKRGRTKRLIVYGTIGLIVLVILLVFLSIILPLII